MSDPGEPSAPSPASPWRHVAAFTLLAGGAALGIVVGALREGTTLTALLLYAEPAPAVLGVCIVHLCFVRDRWTTGVSAAIGLASFLLLSRVIGPLPLAQPRPAPVVGIEALAQCSANGQPPESWILALWSGADDPATVSRLTDEADVVVLPHPRVTLPPIGAGHSGEFREVPGGTIVWSRAGFAACGDEDTWAVGRRSALVFAAPGPNDAVPLLVSDLPPLGQELDSEAAALSDAGGSLGGAVIAAAGSFPTSFRLTDLRLANGGLLPIRVPPNAPEAYRGVRLLPIRAVDRVWVSSSWTGRGRVLDSRAAWSAPVVLRLDATYQTP